MIKLSLAICTYNRAALLSRALRSVAQQTIGRSDVELIVIDNGSTDETAKVVAAHQKENGSLRYFVEPKPGIAHARNRALAEASGEYLAFLDDDAWADPEWLEYLLKPIEALHPAPECVVGPVSLVWEGTRPQWFPARFESLLCRYHMGDEPRFLDAGAYLLTTNSLFNRATLLRLGGMRTDLGHRRKALIGGEDNDIFNRLVAHGYRVFYEPGARVFHPVPKERQTRRFLLKRLFWDGASQPLVEDGQSSTQPWLEFRTDARRSTRFALEILLGTIRGDRLGAEDGLYRLVQRAGRMRTHFVMATRGVQ